MNSTCKYCGTGIVSMDDADFAGELHKDCAEELCKVCGRCCEVMLIQTRFEWSDIDSRYFYETRGIPIVKDNMGGITLVVTQQCPKWEVDKGCTIYEKRPYWCEVYKPWNDPFHASLCPRCAEFEGKQIKRIRKIRPSEDEEDEDELEEVVRDLSWPKK